jgi:hypothetical protein
MTRKTGLNIPPGPKLTRSMWDAHAQPGERYDSPYDRMRVARRYVKHRYGAEGWRAVRLIGPCTPEA